MVGVLGCMAERLKDRMLDRGMVDVVAGPDSYRDLPRLLAIVQARRATVPYPRTSCCARGLLTSCCHACVIPTVHWRWRTAATWVCSRARRSERCLSRGQGEDHEPGQSAMNVQLSHEETYAGAVPSSSADPLPHQLRPASCIRSDRCAACPEHDPHKHCVTWEALRVLPRALHASPL